MPPRKQTEAVSGYGSSWVTLISLCLGGCPYIAGRTLIRLELALKECGQALGVWKPEGTLDTPEATEAMGRLGGCLQITEMDLRN